MALFFSVEDVRFHCQPEPGLDHEETGAAEVADNESGYASTEPVASYASRPWQHITPSLRGSSS